MAVLLCWVAAFCPAMVVAQPAAAPSNLAAAPVNSAAVPANSVAVPEKPTSQLLRLVGLTAEKMEASLRELLGERLKPIENASPDRTGWLFSYSPNSQVEVIFDRRQNLVALRGPDVLVDQLGRLVLAIERSGTPSGRATCVISLRQSDPAQVMQVIEAYRNGQRDGAMPTSHNSAPPATRAAARAGQTSSARNTHMPSWFAQMPLITGMARPVVYRSQSPDAPPPSTAGQAPADSVSPANAAPPATGLQLVPGTPKQDENGAKPSVRSRLRSLDSDLEVETLPDLDAIILRGRPREVEELRRIIDEIERLSTETQPEIEIVYLKETACEPMSAIVKQVEKEFTGGRQGRVSVLPLIKPNALLLIGWGEALKSVKELVQKLDLPVAPDTQFRVFALRNASAADASTTIQGFFSSKVGLATHVKVTADIRTNSLIVQAAPRDLEEVASLVQRLDQPQGEAVRRARVFKLKNALAADVATVLQSAIGASKTGTPGHKNAALELLTLDAKGQQLIRSGLLNDVQVTPDPRANSLVVTGPADGMELLEAIINQLDAPSAVAQIKVFPVHNGDAPSLVAMLRALIPSGSAGDALGSGTGETSLIPVRFSVDLRSNSIIATGSQSHLAIIEALLLRLDEDKGTQRRNAVYQLRNLQAEAAARSINEFLRSERQVQRSTVGAANPFQQIEAEVVVVPEKISNSLIVSATPRFFDDIMEVVKKLDAEPPQVMIQVLIAQVGLDNTDEFGVELGLQDSLLFNRSLLGNLVTTTSTTQTSTSAGVVTQSQTNILGATNAPGFNWNNTTLGNSGSTTALAGAGNVGTQGLSSFGVGRTSSDTGYGGLVLSASSESVSMLIRALQYSRRLDVLSRPQVMTLDNQPAFIQVGKRVPRIATASITQVGQQNNVVLENVGLILGVTPRISPDGRVIMEVDAEKSELGSVEDGIPVTTSGLQVIKSPTIDLTTAQTTVSAIDGETIIIGGLITRKSEVIKRRVPYLSDVPLLGLLFRYDSNSKQRVEMLIILTPHIVRSPADAERVRKMEECRMHWCLGDVNEIDGPVGFNGKQMSSQPVPIVYPDENPRGNIPTPPDVNEPDGLREPSPEAIPLGPTTPSHKDPSMPQ